MDVKLPHDFEPRPYQIPPYQARQKGIRFFDICAHRRSGKDLNAINFTLAQASQRTGLYFHMLPFYSQARKAIWDGADKDGKRFLGRFPEGIIKKKHEQEMKIELINSSIWQLVGADNVDSLLSTNPIGIVFSEWSLMNPRTWEFLRPIIRENGGWAYFIYTPRGHNHGWELHKMAQSNPDWFSQTLTINDTKDMEGHPILTEKDMDEERRSGMPRDMIDQEYYCSFEAGALGAYYSDEIKRVKDSHRLCAIQYDRYLPVYTAWDLGWNDTTSILFYQIYGKEIRIIDFEEYSGKNLAFFVDMLRKKPYRDEHGNMHYEMHTLPHDAASERLEGSGVSMQRQLEELGLTKTSIAPRTFIQDGIQAVRSIFDRLWFNKDEPKVVDFLDGLSQYTKKWDDKRHVFLDNPLHDWTSNRCLLGNTMVKMERGYKRIDEIKAGEYVWTPVGNSLITCAGRVGKAETLSRYTFNNGSELTMTDEHKVFTDRGLVYADDLRYSDRIWNQKSGLKALRLMGSSSHFRDDIISLRPQRGEIIAHCIEQYGVPRMALFLQNTISIIKMAIHLIMPLRILNASLNSSTCLITQDTVHGISQEGTSKFCSQKQFLPLRYGMRAQKEENGIQYMQKNIGQKTMSGFKRNVMNVIEYIKHLFHLDQNSVIRIVNRLRLEGEEAKQWVYDLTVEDHHCYLANGILVSNSDALRYLALNLPADYPPVENYDEPNREISGGRLG